MTRIFVGILLAMVVGAGVSAQSDLPAVARAAIEANGKECNGKVKLLPGFITRRDLNGDGVVDYWMDYEHFQCGDSMSMFCGTGGCVQQVVVSMRDGSYKLVFEENVRQMRFEIVKGRPAMLVDFHGSVCNKVGAAPCPKTFFWDGTSFK